MKRNRLIIRTIIFLSLFIPGNILTSDYSRSFFKRAIELSGKWSQKSERAAFIHSKLLNIMYVSPDSF